jgi:hypothetical protein
MNLNITFIHLSFEKNICFAERHEWLSKMQLKSQMKAKFLAQVISSKMLHLNRYRATLLKHNIYFKYQDFIYIASQPAVVGQFFIPIL